MGSEIRIEVEAFPNTLLSVRPSKNVPRSSRAVFDFLFGCYVDKYPVYQYLLASGVRDCYTVLFHKNNNPVGSLTVSRDVLSTGSLYGALTLVAGRGRLTHSCVFPVKLLSTPVATPLKYVVLSLAEILSHSMIRYVAETLLIFSGVTSFVFPAAVPAVTTAASGATMAATASGMPVATVATAGAVIIGAFVANSLFDSLFKTRSTQYKHHFYHWLGTKRLPANAIGIYERKKRIVKGLVLEEKMNHPRWGFGFVYVCSPREDEIGICLSADVFPQGKETIRRFCLSSGLPVYVFTPLGSYEFKDSKQKDLSLFPLTVTFIDVRESWEALGSDATHQSANKIHVQKERVGRK